MVSLSNYAPFKSFKTCTGRVRGDVFVLVGDFTVTGRLNVSGASTFGRFG
jgi:hypothetical protein